MIAVTRHKSLYCSSVVQRALKYPTTSFICVYIALLRLFRGLPIGDFLVEFLEYMDTYQWKGAARDQNYLGSRPWDPLFINNQIRLIVLARFCVIIVTIHLLFAVPFENGISFVHYIFLFRSYICIYFEYSQMLRRGVSITS